MLAGRGTAVSDARRREEAAFAERVSDAVARRGP